MTTEEDKGLEEDQQPIPIGQKLMDNLLWLFLISLLLSFVIYNGWGLLELMRVP